MILVDLPGVQRPRDSLTRRMQRRVERELADADCVLLVVNGEQGIGPGDRFIAQTLLEARERRPVVCAVNKCDRLNTPRTAEVLEAAAELEIVDEVFPVSARTGAGLEPLVGFLAAQMPESPYLYPPEDTTDSASETHLAELIREQVLRRTRAEVPHAVEVMVESTELRDDGLFEVHAQVWVETESQKAILIGRRGRMIRDIGTAARGELERELGGRVFLASAADATTSSSTGSVSSERPAARN
jgi:GTP-binding protein Era